MTSESLPSRFYRIVYFSPRPEDGERVCVALIIWDEGRTYFLFDRNARKARGLSREYGTDVIIFMLEQLEEKASQIAVSGVVTEFSPQIQISGPRVLLKPADETVRNILVHTYLSPQKGFRSPAKQPGISGRIETFLSKYHVPQGSIIRRATAQKLFGKEAVRRLPAELIPGPVARAVNVGDGLLLLDGVDIHASTNAVVEHVARVTHTYWQCKKAQGVLHDKSVKLTSAAVVFDGDGGTENQSFLWRIRYAMEQFEKDADHTINPSTPEGQNELRSLLTETHAV